MMTEQLIYRVQYSTDKWILRHPEIIMPRLQHEDKEELIKLLPDYFKNNKEPVVVKILDDWGRVMEERVYP